MIKLREINETIIQQDKKMWQIHEQLKKICNLYKKEWKFITIYDMRTYLCLEWDKKFIYYNHNQIILKFSDWFFEFW